MLNSVASIGTLLRLAQQAPNAARVLTAAAKVREGRTEENADQFDEALSYLKQDGWADALDVLKPGAGEMGRQVAQQAVDAFQQIRATVRGDYAEYEDVAQQRIPWRPFLNRLFSEPNSANILLGPTGSGKTQLALKLAYRWHKQLGYQVDCVELYGEDRPEWARAITTKTLRRRMEQLHRHLEAEAIDDEGWEPDEDAQPVPPGMPPQNRVVIIDEAGMVMGSHGSDPGRRAALRCLAQSRHLRYHVLYLGQWAGQIPLPLFGQSVVWVKEPGGREVDVDRDNRVIRDLWERAAAGFSAVRSNPWWYNFPTEKAWAYCDCVSLNGRKGHTGMIPFTMAPTWDTDEEYPTMDGEDTDG